MNKTELMTKASGFVAKAAFQLKRYSPEILVAAGIIGTVTSAVLACRATLKVKPVLEEAKEDIDSVNRVENDDGEVSDATKKELTKVYVKTGLKIARLYAPAVVLGAASITGIVSSHNIMKKRNFALASAYAAIDRSFKGYRSRVAEKFGEEVEKNLFYDIKEEKIEETTVDPETGKEKKVKKTVQVMSSDPTKYSPYARYFDENSTYWHKAGDLNFSFLSGSQGFFSQKLRANKYLFLDDVYDALGLPKSAASRVVGWIYDPFNDTGDNYVDFRFREVYVPGEDGLCVCKILIDPNVDGNILEKFEEIEMR